MSKTLVTLLAKCRELGISLPGDDSEYKLRRVRGSKGKYSGTFAWALQPIDINRWGELMPVEVASYYAATDLVKEIDHVTVNRLQRGLVDHGYILEFKDTNL